MKNGNENPTIKQKWFSNTQALSFRCFFPMWITSCILGEKPDYWTGHSSFMVIHWLHRPGLHLYPHILCFNIWLRNSSWNFYPYKNGVRILNSLAYLTKNPSLRTDCIINLFLHYILLGGTLEKAYRGIHWF